MTEWKSLEFLGYPMYMVSSEGNVRNVKTGKLIKPCINHRGYYSVSLCKEGKCKCFLLHRLVAQAFISNEDNLPEVNHKNRVRTDNNVSNLEFCTGKYNIQYSNLNRALCKYDSKGNLLSKYWSVGEAARCNGISKQGLRHYLNGKRVTVAYHGFIYRYEGQSPFEAIRNDEAIERDKERSRQYRQKNKECIKEKNRQYYQKNKERVLEQMHDYYRQNDERIKEQKRQYLLQKKSEQAQEKPTLNN